MQLALQLESGAGLEHPGTGAPPVTKITLPSLLALGPPPTVATNVAGDPLSETLTVVPVSEPLALESYVTPPALPPE